MKRFSSRVFLPVTVFCFLLLTGYSAWGQDNYYFNTTATSGVTPAGQQMQTAVPPTNGASNQVTITGTPQYWYTPPITCNYATGTYQIILWVISAPSSITVQLASTDSSGGTVTILGSNTQPTNCGGNCAVTFSISSVPALNLVNQLLRVNVTLASGPALNVIYYDSFFNSRLIAPSTCGVPTNTPTITFTPTITPTPTITNTPTPVAASITKSESETTGALNDLVTYTMSVTNSSPAPLTCIDNFEADSAGSFPGGWTGPNGGTQCGTPNNVVSVGGAHNNVFQITSLNVGFQACYSTYNCPGQVTDGSICADVNVTSGRAELLWRQNGSSTYQVSLGPSAADGFDSEIRVITNGAYVVLAKVNKGYLFNTWYNVCMIVNGFNITMQVNGTTVLTATDTNSSFSAGNAGLQSSTVGTAQFDNVTVIRGSTDYLNTVVNDTLPAGLTYVSCSGAVCSNNAGTVDWNLGTVPAGTTANVTLVAQVNTCPTTVTNQASWNIGLPFSKADSNQVSVSISCFTNTPTNTPTNSPTRTPTPTATNSATATPTSSPTLTATPTASSSPTNTGTNTPTATPSNTATITPTATPSSTATQTPTNTPTSSPTNSPTVTSTATPSNTATNSPTPTPSSTPSNTDTVTPTATPSDTATTSPTNTPTSTATNSPTITPTSTPTNTYTVTSTNTVTNTPTVTPTNTPTSSPTNSPTVTPTNTPTNTWTVTPTPTVTSTPTLTATNTPTSSPTNTATVTPTPTITPTFTVTFTPTPTFSPTVTSTPTPPAPYTVRVAVYNAAGEVVRELFVKQLSLPINSIDLPGGNAITTLRGANNQIAIYSQGILIGTWNGMNTNGDPVSNGGYFLKIDNIDSYGVDRSVIQPIIVSRKLARIKVNLYNETGEIVRHLYTFADDPTGTSLTDVSVGSGVVAPSSQPAGNTNLQITLQTSEPGMPMTMTWDGKSDTGNVVTAGHYQLEVHWTDGAGSTSDISRGIMVVGGAPQAGVSASPNVLTGANGSYTTVFSTNLPGAQELKASLYTVAGELMGTAVGPASGTAWSALGTASGTYLAVVEVKDGNGGLMGRKILKLLVIH